MIPSQGSSSSDEEEEEEKHSKQKRRTKKEMEEYRTRKALWHEKNDKKFMMDQKFSKPQAILNSAVKNIDKQPERVLHEEHPMEQIIWFESIWSPHGANIKGRYKHIMSLYKGYSSK